MPEGNSGRLFLRRWLYLFLVLGSTALAALQMWRVLRFNGFSPLEMLILPLFTILFGWIAASFWLALFGAWTKCFGIKTLTLRDAVSPTRSGGSRTAILMPVYNEDVGQVFSGLRAVMEALAGQPDFDFYILSDSTSERAWIAEELEWQTLRAAPGGGAAFYRHRARNSGRKAGNIQDFCENWGALYDYMVILDADSLMTGETLTALVALMDANPRTALIQAPAMLVGRNSVFARLQQFSSSAYGPLVQSGLAWLQSADGNYWGHNAIIRIRPFMDHCGLPRLPGAPPFGGAIMSHDFIEAAFLRRAGWDVWMAADLGGSYEEPPPTMLDHLKRDRRWCQGNLQHLRIVFARGLTLPSRLHLAMGIMTYLSSPLWLFLLLASGVWMVETPPDVPVAYVGIHPALALTVSHAASLLGLVAATLVLLFGPKIIAMVMTGINDRRRHGGWGGLLASAGLESLVSTLFAPVVMLTHSGFVASILLGRSSGWGAQHRTDRALPWRVAAGAFWPHLLVGFGAGWLLWRSAPQSFGWFVPLLAGLVLAIPLVVATSSLAMGRALARAGIFLVPSESEGLPVLERAQALATARVAPDGDVRRLVLTDAAVRRLHLGLLVENPARQNAADDLGRLAALVARARAGDTGFSSEDWKLLLSDPDSLSQAVLG